MRYHRYADAYIVRNELSDEDAFVTKQVAPLDLPSGEPLRLRIFQDRSVIEVFTNERFVSPGVSIRR